MSADHQRSEQMRDYGELLEEVARLKSQLKQERKESRRLAAIVRRGRTHYEQEIARERDTQGV